MQVRLLEAFWYIALSPSDSRAAPAQSRAFGALCRGLRPRVRRLRRTGLVKQPCTEVDLMGPSIQR